MVRVLILVEGQTEERVVKDVFQPHLSHIGVFPVPKIVTTKTTKQGPHFKGGLSAYSKVDRDLRRLLGDTDAAAVTTLIDYYGLPTDFPGSDSRPRGPARARAAHVEREWQAAVNHPRFRPHLMVHELEALMFVSPEELARTLHRPAALGTLQNIRAEFPTPEDINENPDTAPSKRILSILPDYQKQIHGPLILQRVGLNALRAECPHFADWLTWLEGLA